MIRALHTSATGMLAQQLNMDTIANNLANANTAGFKRTRIDFEDLMYQTLKVSGSPSGAGGSEIPTGVEVGLGVRPAATQKLFSQGVFQQTENPFDLAIEGDGLFQIKLPNGETAYTRNGSFKKDSEGKIVTSDGYVIEPSIVIPPEAMQVAISADGTVSITVQGSTKPQTIGQITLAKFVNPAGLNTVGKNLFIESAASGSPNVATPGENGLGSIAQGFIENANVQVVEEMVNMIIAQRAYEIISKTIQGADDMLQVASNLRR
jgi:flagellar basal-body rod protein FlgG